jgi:hypothetical protein
MNGTLDKQTRGHGDTGTRRKGDALDKDIQERGTEELALIVHCSGWEIIATNWLNNSSHRLSRYDACSGVK